MSDGKQLMATDIVKLSTHVIKLNQLLAWDLATTQQHLNKSFYSVQLTMLNGNKNTLFLTTAELEPLLSELIATQLQLLTDAGVNTQELLDNYKATGEQLLGVQQNKNALDNGQNV